jgi:hypothetical protein
VSCSFLKVPETIVSNFEFSSPAFSLSVLREGNFSCGCSAFSLAVCRRVK